MIELTNIDELQDRLLNKLDAASRRIDKITAGAADIVVDGIKEHVLSSMSYTGKPLAPNAPSTVAEKKFNWPLVRTSAMVKGITKKAIPDGWLVYLSNKPEIGSKLQKGFEVIFRGRAYKVPARPFFGISKLIRANLKNYLNGVKLFGR